MWGLFSVGWLLLVLLVGSLKFQVSFAEYRFFYRALLQKRPIILRILLIEANPYMRVTLDRFMVRLVCVCMFVCFREYMCVCDKAYPTWNAFDLKSQRSGAWVFFHWWNRVLCLDTHLFFFSFSSLSLSLSCSLSTYVHVYIILLCIHMFLYIYVHMLLSKQLWPPQVELAVFFVHVGLFPCI